MSAETLDREADALTLVTPPDTQDALAVFAAKDTAAADRIIAQVKAKAAEFQAMAPDVSTPAGRDLIRRFAHRITKSKTAIEAVGAALAAEQKEVPKRIDATRRHFKDSLDQIRDEVRQPLTDWEAAEEARVFAIKSMLADFQDHIDGRGDLSLADLANVYRDLTCMELVANTFQEYLSAAKELQGKAAEAVKARIAVAEKREAEAAELAKLREAQATREREDRERQIAEAAAAKAKADAAAAVTAAEEAKRAAEQRAIDAAAKAKADAEREIAARQAREAAEAKRREEDRAHRAAVHRAALEALVAGGITEGVAKTVVILIATGKVPGAHISY